MATTKTDFAIYSTWTGCIAERMTSRNTAARKLAKYGEGYAMAEVSTKCRCRVMVPAHGTRPMQWLG